ncbi:glutathione S-transferase family protein [Piscinibacter gummiphilus]|uniref:Glutathione S-transferase n=1 Tax=Piscinibacter gummiphilus TaxID=946333 RepID=A0A1W6L4C7_9BURK|nr:glutathione S-transferase family protein [Piscinibacter gummiphilus]ARN19094.1 glutathione S-transferase [Piscinibacter gummiphilus]ATU63744.1 glutathione S-transferase family protein [Piscinibacter gummiphilus]GLS93321.1 glutathione S-transferase [Piscinibacter gummiphilus]
MITLHDFDLSGSCYKIRLFLNILGLKFERVPVDFGNREHKSAKYLALNPFGELPVFQDGDLVLRDTQAILVYLATRYDPSRQWYPDDPVSMGRIQQWLSTGGGEVMNASGARLVKCFGVTTLDLDKLQAGAHRVFRIMDDRLAATGSYLALEDRATLGDIACFPYTALAGEGGIDLAAYPHILAWIDRLRRLPGFIPMPGIPALP